MTLISELAFFISVHNCSRQRASEAGSFWTLKGSYSCNLITLKCISSKSSTLGVFAIFRYAAAVEANQHGAEHSFKQNFNWIPSLYLPARNPASREFWEMHATYSIHLASNPLRNTTGLNHFQSTLGSRNPRCICVFAYWEYITLSIMVP